MFLIVPFGLFHMCFRLNSLTLVSSVSVEILRDLYSHRKKVFEQYQLLKSACLIYITTNVPGVMVAHLIATLYLQNIVFDVRNIEQLKVHVTATREVPSAKRAGSYF